jgi:hypothetical protein
MKFSIFAKCVAAYSLWIFSALEVAGQPIDPNAVTEEDVQKLNEQRIAVFQWTKSPKSLAAQLIEDYDYVVDGYFENFPQQAVTSSEAQPPNTGDQRLIATFVIERVLIGNTDSKTAEVLLNPEMLDYAGEGISQFQKRQSIIDSQLIEYNSIEQAIAALKSARDRGEITAEVFDSAAAKLNVAKTDIINAGLILQNRERPLHSAEDFYTLGGAIKAGERYLLGLSPNSSPSSSSSYELLEFPIKSRNIFWGETRTKMLEAF